MVYICVALYAEAKPIIEQFQMKQLEHQGRFKVYQDEEKRYLLIITGVGQISAAIAVSHICTKYGVNDEDHLMNIGSCAGERAGQIYLCHKIENQTNNSIVFSRFPILYKGKRNIHFFNIFNKGKYVIFKIRQY